MMLNPSPFSKTSPVHYPDSPRVLFLLESVPSCNLHRNLDQHLIPRSRTSFVLRTAGNVPDTIQISIRRKQRRQETPTSISTLMVVSSNFTSRALQRPDAPCAALAHNIDRGKDDPSTLFDILFVMLFC